jgi:hypothetical protein
MKNPDTTSEQALREKLKKIEALFDGAATAGERSAAAAAAERIRAQLQQATRTDTPEEIRCSIPNIFSRKLFIALCRRYGLRPYRYPRMHSQTIVIRAPRRFFDNTLWPEFQTMNDALYGYLGEWTDRLIREEIHAETQDADIVAEPRRIT